MLHSQSDSMDIRTSADQLWTQNKKLPSARQLNIKLNAEQSLLLEELQRGISLVYG